MATPLRRSRRLRSQSLSGNESGGVGSRGGVGDDASSVTSRGSRPSATGTPTRRSSRIARSSAKIGGRKSVTTEDLGVIPEAINANSQDAVEWVKVFEDTNIGDSDQGRKEGIPEEVHIRVIKSPKRSSRHSLAPHETMANSTEQEKAEYNDRSEKPKLSEENSPTDDTDYNEKREMSKDRGEKETKLEGTDSTLGENENCTKAEVEGAPSSGKAPKRKRKAVSSQSNTGSTSVQQSNLLKPTNLMATPSKVTKSDQSKSSDGKSNNEKGVATSSTNAEKDNDERNQADSPQKDVVLIPANAAKKESATSASKDSSAGKLSSSPKNQKKRRKSAAKSATDDNLNNCESTKVENEQIGSTIRNADSPLVKKEQQTGRDKFPENGNEKDKSSEPNDTATPLKRAKEQSATPLSTESTLDKKISSSSKKQKKRRKSSAKDSMDETLSYSERFKLENDKDDEEKENSRSIPTNEIRQTSEGLSTENENKKDKNASSVNDAVETLEKWVKEGSATHVSQDFPAEKTITPSSKKQKRRRKSSAKVKMDDSAKIGQDRSVLVEKSSDSTPIKKAGPSDSLNTHVPNKSKASESPSSPKSNSEVTSYSDKKKQRGKYKSNAMTLPFKESNTSELETAQDGQAENANITQSDSTSTDGNINNQTLSKDLNQRKQKNSCKLTEEGKKVESALKDSTSASNVQENDRQDASETNIPSPAMVAKGEPSELEISAFSTCGDVQANSAGARKHKKRRNKKKKDESHSSETAANNSHEQDGSVQNISVTSASNDPVVGNGCAQKRKRETPFKCKGLAKSTHEKETSTVISADSDKVISTELNKEKRRRKKNLRSKAVENVSEYSNVSAPVSGLAHTEKKDDSAATISHLSKKTQITPRSKNKRNRSRTKEDSQIVIIQSFVDNAMDYSDAATDIAGKSKNASLVQAEIPPEGKRQKTGKKLDACDPKIRLNGTDGKSKMQKKHKPLTKEQSTELQNQTRSKAIKPSKEEKKLVFDVSVHRMRFLKLQLKPITAMASSPLWGNGFSSESDIDQNFFLHHLAVSREGGRVELLCPQDRWVAVGEVPGVRGREVDALTWVCGNIGNVVGSPPLTEEEERESLEPIHIRSRDRSNLAQMLNCQCRLFGCSRDGTIFELDFATKRQIGVIGTGGGGAFCMASLCSSGKCHSLEGPNKNKSRKCGGYFAVGVEDGSIKIYRAFNSDGGANSAVPELVSTLPSAGSAVLSLAWIPGQSGSDDGGMGGSVIFAGVADGTIRRYDCVISILTGPISTGSVLSSSTSTSFRWRSTLRMTVETRGLRESTKIWALKALSDFTVISGDSLGHVQIWDGMSGTMSQTFDHNESGADVLCLAVSEDENKIFASGIDARIMCIQRQSVPSFEETDRSPKSVLLETSPMRKWINSCAHRQHSHDVTSLAICKKMPKQGSKATELLVSGGVDTKFCTYVVDGFRTRRPRMWYNWPSLSPINLSCGRRLLSVMRDEKIDLYRVNELKQRAVPLLKPEEQDEKQCYLKTISIQGLFNLNCAAISNDGKFLAASDASSLYIFSLEVVVEEGGTTDLLPKKLSVPKAHRLPSTALKFDDTGRLICATIDGPIAVLKITGYENRERIFEIALEHSFKEHMIGLPPKSHHFPVVSLEISPDGKYLAAARFSTVKGSVHVFRLPENEQEDYRHWWSVPATEATTTCIKFLGGENIDSSLAVGCSTNAIYIFNLSRRSLSHWSNDMGFPISNHLPKELTTRKEPVVRIASNPATPQKFIMGAHGFFCAVDLDQKVPEMANAFPQNHLRAKKQQVAKEDGVIAKESVHLHQISNIHSNAESDNKNFTICLRYNAILFQEFVAENEMVVVEQPWTSVLEQLPDALVRRVYGS